MKMIRENVSPDITDQINKAIKLADEQFQPYFFNLSNDDRKGLRTMAEGREGLARLISQIAIAHPNVLSRDDDPAELEAMINYDAQLESTRQLLIKLSEKITETQLTNGADAMKIADSYTAYLQNARNRNAALDEALKPVDEWNKRFGRTQSAPEVIDSEKQQ